MNFVDFKIPEGVLVIFWGFEGCFGKFLLPKRFLMTFNRVFQFLCNFKNFLGYCWYLFNFMRDRIFVELNHVDGKGIHIIFCRT